MLMLVNRDEEEVCHHASNFVAKAIRRKASRTLGLATGTTMVGVYRELVRLHREEHLDFSRVTTFNLDEYCGLSPEITESFHHAMHEHFFSHVNVNPHNIHIPDGTITGDYEEYCAAYEQAIRDAGGIDLQILGIGRNGHIGFNEPTSSIGSRTRLKVLSKQTIEDNRKLFAAGEEIPLCAITMGIGTILEARKILLLASGEPKAAAVAKSIEGPITSSVPASALHLHPNLTFLLARPPPIDLTHPQ